MITDQSASTMGSSEKSVGSYRSQVSHIVMADLKLHIHSGYKSICRSSYDETADIVLNQNIHQMLYSKSMDILSIIVTNLTNVLSYDRNHSNKQTVLPCDP